MGLLFLVGVLVVLIVLDFAALRYGFDGSEPFDSREWERRRTWPW